MILGFCIAIVLMVGLAFAALFGIRFFLFKSTYEAIKMAGGTDTEALDWAEGAAFPSQKLDEYRKSLGL